MRILGINPGVRGGLGIVEVNNGVHRSSSNAIDVQTVGIGAKERIDAIAIRGWIQTYRPDHAAIERAQAMPKQGVSSGFKYRRAVGTIEAAILCCENPDDHHRAEHMEEIPSPSRW